jgi:predicted phage terminase large subunit-like protein
LSTAIDYLSDREGLHREYAQRNLAHFIKLAWAQVEPSYKFINNWHVDAICDHLQALAARDIRQLIINIPPRCMKSLTCAVFFPAWRWTTVPHEKYVYASYAQNLSVRDSMKMRRLVKSSWYQERWPMKMEDDQDNKMKYQNEYSGYRLATAIKGVGTGEGGDFIIADDPHNVVEGESELVRKGVVEWWDESMSTRLNDPKTGCRLVIMQRVHERDLCGHLLEKGGWTHLMLPMEFEPERKCYVEATKFSDPRTQDGELLWPERIGESEIAMLKTNMGAYAYAGQEQQRPAPRKGAMIDVDLIEMRMEPSAPIKKIVRAWDKAGTEDAGARTAGIKIALLESGRICILDVVKGQWAATKRNNIMKNTAELDGKLVRIYIEQEGGSGGKESAENSVKQLAGFKAYVEVPKGDKEMRAEPFAIQVGAHNVECLVRSWTQEYIDELRTFPAGKYKDQTDATSLAIKKLTDKSGTVHA